MATYNCDDCKDTGIYQGLSIIEPCQACGGGSPLVVDIDSWACCKVCNKPVSASFHLHKTGFVVHNGGCKLPLMPPCVPGMIYTLTGAESGASPENVIKDYGHSIGDKLPNSQKIITSIVAEKTDYEFIGRNSTIDIWRLGFGSGR